MSGELCSLASSSFRAGGQEVVENENVVAVDMRNASIFGPEQEKDQETGVYHSLESLKAVAILDGCVAFFAFFKRLIIQRKQAIRRPPLPRIATVLHIQPAGDVI